MYLSPRGENMGEGTLRNLQRLKFPYDPQRDQLLLGEEWTNHNKREEVARKFRILLIISDYLGDFMHNTAQEPAVRREMADRYADNWGLKWFIVPNPMYGHWDYSLYHFNYGLDRSEQLADKLRALDPEGHAQAKDAAAGTAGGPNSWTMAADVTKSSSVSPAADTGPWPEGSIVKGRVVDHQGAPVANAEVYLLGEEQVIVDGRKLNVFVLGPTKTKPPSAKTDSKGQFSVQRQRGTANRLLVTAADPLYWEVMRKDLPADGDVDVKLPQSGSLAIHCDLPGKPAKQPVEIDLLTLDDVTWHGDMLRLSFRPIAGRKPR